MAEGFFEEAREGAEGSSLHSNNQSAIELANNPMNEAYWCAIPLHPQDDEGWCILIAKDIHESESSIQAGQYGHVGEADKLFSFCKSSRLRIQVWATQSHYYSGTRGERMEDGTLLLRWLLVSKWDITGVVESDCRPWQKIALGEVLCGKNCEAQLYW